MDDITAACKLIERMRKRDKKNKSKTVTIKLFKENEHVVSTCLTCKYMPTDTVSYGHYLSYFSYTISPTINNKLKCINEAGLLQLKKKRIYSNNWQHENNIRFCDSIGKNIELIENLHYNIKTGSICYNTKFQSKLKLVRIDIK